MRPAGLEMIGLRGSSPLLSGGVQLELSGEAPGWPDGSLPLGAHQSGSGAHGACGIHRLVGGPLRSGSNHGSRRGDALVGGRREVSEYR